ncbi:MAG: CPBP family intramembrane metalloprotease [Clostridia bacterium]|nr:CPBP family intramembrane metalloprotease [Clostridia bacterium]
MTNLEKSAKKDTVSMIITLLLYGVGAASVPYAWLAGLFSAGKEAEWITAFVLKAVCSVLPVYLIFQFGFGDLLRLNGKKLKASILTLPAILVMVNNLPILPVMSSNMSINGTFSKFICYGLFCLSIGIIEETVYRGCLLPLCAFKCSRDKKGLFWAVVISSALFGAMHLFNLFAGFSPVVFLQVGYSFLIGAVCAFALIVSGNIYLPILLHATFDFGGFLLSEGLATGELWTAQNVIWTAVSSVVLAVVIIIIFIKKDFSHVFDDWNLNRLEERKEEV